MRSLRLLICLLALAAPLRAVELPIVFEPNVGQTDPQVKFLSRGPGATLFLTGDEAVLALSGKVLRIRLEGARPGTAEALEPLPGVTHYYRGNDPSKWRTNVPQYGRVKLSGVYPGTDLAWYGREGSFEFDFVLAPGADPEAIALSFAGAERLELSAAGDLVLHLPGGSLILQKPFCYQEVDGERREVASRYRLDGGRVGFELAAWDRSRPLVIDPVLDWSSFLGGSGKDRVTDVAVDAAGSVYATGNTDSPDFPGSDLGEPDNFALYVTRIDDAGQGLVFTALLDGRGTEIATSIAVDDRGSAYVAGQTESRDFPLLDPFQSELSPGIGYLRQTFDAFVVKVTSSGELVFSTYLGGRSWEAAEAIALDAGRRVYVAGWSYSNNFPLENPIQEDELFAGTNAFLTVFNADGQSLAYSTLLGGAADDEAEALAVDSAGNAYVAGDTRSDDFPLKGAFQQHRGEADAFVAKIDPAASGAASLIYSTYLGGPGTDGARGIAVDAAGQAHVTGLTGSTAFPLKAPPGRTVIDATNVVNEAFVTKLNAQGNDLVFSTFLGGSDIDLGTSIALDGSGAVYVVGRTSSTNFPVRNPSQRNLRGATDTFVAKIDPFASTLLWSTFLGGLDDDLGTGVALDARGNVYLGGETFSGATFPRVDAFQDEFGGEDRDGFLSRFGATAPDTIGVFREGDGKHFLRNSNTTGPADLTVTLGQAGDLPVAGNWIGSGARPGIFRAGTFILKRFNNDILCCNLTFAFGQAGDLPLAGDWDGDGVDTIGVFQGNRFLLRNSNSAGPEDFNFAFGAVGDIPVAGDWDGDGVDGMGVFRPSTGEFFLRNGFAGPIDLIFLFGQPGDLPVTGDWDGDGTDTIGVFRAGQFLLRNRNSAGPEDLAFAFGIGTDLPLAGDWDGRP